MVLIACPCAHTILFSFFYVPKQYPNIIREKKALVYFSAQSHFFTPNVLQWTKIWENKVNQLFFSHFGKPNVFEWITKMENFCPKGQKILFFRSTKVHKLFFSHFVKPSVLKWIDNRKNLALKVISGPLKYTSLIHSSTLAWST